MKRWWNLIGHQLTIPPEQTEIPSKGEYVYYFRSQRTEKAAGAQLVHVLAHRTNDRMEVSSELLLDSTHGGVTGHLHRIHTYIQVGQTGISIPESHRVGRSDARESLC